MIFVASPLRLQTLPTAFAQKSIECGFIMLLKKTRILIPYYLIPLSRNIEKYNLNYISAYTDNVLKSLEAAKHSPIRIIMGCPRSTRIVDCKAIVLIKKKQCLDWKSWDIMVIMQIRIQPLPNNKITPQHGVNTNLTNPLSKSPNSMWGHHCTHSLR